MGIIIVAILLGLVEYKRRDNIQYSIEGNPLGNKYNRFACTFCSREEGHQVYCRYAAEKDINL